MSGKVIAFGSAPSLKEMAGYDLNDYGNAMRLIRLAGGVILEEGDVDASASRLLYQHGAGWVGFNGRFWDRTFGEDLARRMTHRVAQHLRACFSFFEDKMTSAAAMKFIDGAGQAGSSSAMLRQAQSYLTVEIDAFDRDPWAINCRNGTLRLRDAAGKFAPRLDPHDPADRITRMAAVAYDADAKSPLFERVAGEALKNLEEYLFFRRWLGYASTGCIHEQAFVLTQGKGRDGKSTVLDACREALGSYGAVGNVATFLDAPTNAQGPDPELVKLAGDVRLVILSEPKRGQQLAEGRLKQWTSGSPISARDLQAKPISFRPCGKLTFECNELPVIKSVDDGIWRRVLTPIFRDQVPDDRVDKTLPDRIRANELPGVLNWLIAGVGDWMARGLDPPASLKSVADEYRKSSSPFGEWLAERCVYGDAARGERTESSELLRDYKSWMEDQGHEKPMSSRAFGDALRGKQVMLAGKNGAGRKLRGPIRLKTPAEIAADDMAAANVASPAAGGLSGVGDGSRVDGILDGFDLPADDLDDGDDGFGGGFGG